LTRKVYLIDSPGVIPSRKNISPEDLLLCGAIRIERVEEPSAYIPAVLDICKPEHVARTYGIDALESSSFLDALARKYGRLFPGGEPDNNAAARIVLQDFTRGKLPWFKDPPCTTHGVHGNEER
jgi:nuclear GTP-binding protein